MRLVVIIVVFTFFSCTNSRDSSLPDIYVQLDSLDLDSVGIRVIHYMDGKELMDTSVKVGEKINLGKLDEDMYLFVAYWPRTFIPHNLYNNRSFNKEMGDNYTLTKAFYVSPQESNLYSFNMTKLYTVENVEIDLISAIEIVFAGCEKCKLADDYWQNYNSFFARKDSTIQQKSNQYYTTIDNNIHVDSKKSFAEIEAIKNNQWSDSLYLTGFSNLLTENSKSKVSSFFVFYQLYTDRNLEKYKPFYQLLTGEAKASKYYRMLYNQYSK